VGTWGFIIRNRHLYGISNIVRVVKSRRLCWTEHVSHMVKTRNAYTTFMEGVLGKQPL
jgi:hypothetical protein